MRPENPNSLATVDSLKRNPLNCFQHHGNSCSIEVWVVDEDDNLKHETVLGCEFNFAYLRFVNAPQDDEGWSAKKSQSRNKGSNAFWVIQTGRLEVSVVAK
jgi:hypothetical protein